MGTETPPMLCIRGNTLVDRFSLGGANWVEKKELPSKGILL